MSARGGCVQFFAGLVTGLLAVFLVAGGAFFSANAARAGALEDKLVRLSLDHDKVRAAVADLEAARQRRREATADWYPTLDQTANYGYENQTKPDARDTSAPFWEYDVSLTQKLWDFGKTGAAIAKAELQLKRSEVALTAAQQDLILEASTAYVELVRARQMRASAQASESNIREQTGLEEARVESGSGLSTDVL